MDTAILGWGAARARSRKPKCRRWGESMGLPWGVGSSRAGALPDPPQRQGRLLPQSSPSEDVCVQGSLHALPLSQCLCSLSRSQLIQLLFQRKAEVNRIPEKKPLSWLLPSLNATHIVINCIFTFGSKVQLAASQSNANQVSPHCCECRTCWNF